MNDYSASLVATVRVAKEFRLKKEEALLIIKKVASIVKQWRKAALQLGLPKQEWDRMSSAFVYEENKSFYTSIVKKWILDCNSEDLICHSELSG